ncbi:MAG: hypothetical protein JWO25_1201 [Alphaproteobacteria bacterium]|nr:hypothetical protein [Alphaproteobacteria bacterium]
MSKRVERVVVVGRDAAAWLAALALRRAFGPVGVEVEVVELPSLLHAVDVYAALPSLAGLHRLVGLDEREMLRACAGVPVGGQRFTGWSGGDGAFVHGYDVQRLAIEDLDFLQYWIKARGEGLRVPFEDFSPAASAAKQGRIGRGDGDPSSLGALQHGYHLDARAYAALARRKALSAGVRARTEFAAAEFDANSIAAIRLDDGSRIEADLFVDASGAEAVLIGGLAGSDFESWGRWLPANRILAASAPALKPLPAFAQISAVPAGWIGLHPLRDRTALVAAFSSEQATDAEMLESAARMTGLRFGGDAIAAPFAPGIRRSPWIGNCVALGEAAVALEPLDSVQLHLVHAGISNLVALFPATAGEMPESVAYANAIASHARNVRDFQVAHYRLNRRTGEALWDRAREPEGPVSLAARLDLFGARGRVVLYDDETFEEQSWAAILIGHGLMPRSHDLKVDKVPPREQMERFQNLLRLIAGEVRAMPTADQWLEPA